MKRPCARLALALLPTIVLAASFSLAPSASAQRVALGAYIPEAGWHPGRIQRFAAMAGRAPVIVSDYRQWDQPPFDRSQLSAVWRRGAVPMITWEPMSYHGRRYPLRAIAAGRYDGYLRRSARAARAWDKPIFVRFAHEMNGDWYPWGVGAPGVSAGLYKSAWRHVVRVFRREGADRVRWVWCPNVNQGGEIPFAGQYPGDSWVDWVGLDGFNWGYGGRSYSFGQIFGSSYRTLRRLSPKPVMIAETGTYAHGRAKWISQALGRQLRRFGRVKALVWFNRPANGVGFRFDRPRAARDAFRRAVQGRTFHTSRSRLLASGER